MGDHLGKRIFITGIPTPGKSFLAKKLADELGGIAVDLDEIREIAAADEVYRKWTHFYLELDEEKYLATTDAETQWANLVAQSEGLWPVFLAEIQRYKDEPRPAIFECVNILPHLAVRDLPFPGIVLIGSSYDEILKRNIESPRWGETLELQKLEAKYFYEVERPRYKIEAEKYGYPVFESSAEAFPHALGIMTSLPSSFNG